MTFILRRTALLMVASALTTALLAAQAVPTPPTRPIDRELILARELVTRTIQLRNLKAVDAARLVSPYVRSPQAGVYEAGSVQAITVIETEQVLARIDSLIREIDRSPAVLSFRFQVIAANDTPGRDPAIESLDATLRGLFRFKGYHLIGEGTTSASESEGFSLTIAAGEDRFVLNGEVLAVQPHLAQALGVSPTTGGGVRVRVRLARMSGGTYQGKPMESESLLSTGLTVPLGQTVVLGSGAPGGPNQALILTVRPEIAIPSRR